jgi:glycerophosphoryl diester phosphodiesterase
LADRAILSAFDEDDHGSGEDPKTTSRWSDLYAVKDMVRIALIATDKKIATMGGAAAYILAAKNAGVYAVNPRKTAITRDLVMAAHKAGLLVNAWTVNGKTMYKRFSGYGVDNVFCDNPDFLIG